ncbi:MAG: SBBP repeat-containing protein, partial [Chitinophagaceae bacterium]
MHRPIAAAHEGIKVNNLLVLNPRKRLQWKSFLFRREADKKIVAQSPTSYLPAQARAGSWMRPNNPYCPKIVKDNLTKAKPTISIKYPSSLNEGFSLHLLRYSKVSGNPILLMLQRYISVFLFICFLPVYAMAQSLEFVRNDGQWDGPFQYKALSQNGDAFLSKTSFTYMVGEAANGYKMDEVHHGRSKSEQLRFHTYRVHFEGANQQPEIVASKEQSWYYNYFLGNDSTRWKSNIHPALALDYNALYPGVDMHVTSQNGNLKYEFIVAPNTDPDIIQLRYDGVDGLKIKDKNLVISTSVGEAEELMPVAFQYSPEGARKEVACRYVLKGNNLTYKFPDGYDSKLTLVIDPTVVFCTLTGSTADNWGYTATYDDSGNFYAGGIMLSYLGGSYPVTTGAFQTTFGGGVDDPNYATSDAHGVGFASDMAIMKLNSTGSTRIWATYLGGSDNEQPHSIIKDPSGNLVIAGISYSNNFPTTSGAYDVSVNGGADIVVTKLNSTGSGLAGSTYIGGSGDDGVNYNGSEYIFGNLKHNYGDNARSEVLVDKSGNVYVTASTKSSNFPVTSNAFQSSIGGGQDAVVMKFNSTLSSLTYSTFLGGSSDDAGYVLALDTAQTHFYVGGGTMSSNFPSTTGTWKTTYQGGSADGYIARFGNSGTYPLQKVTFIGTSDYDQVYGVQVDLENNVYAVGQTLGGSFPVTSGVYSNAG